MTRIIPNFIAELAAAITPFLGVISSGASVAWGTKNMIRDEYRSSQARMHLERSMSKETPEKAIESIIRIIDREFTNNALTTGIASAEFATKMAGALADGGTATTVAVGLAANLARLANLVRNVVRDVQEKNAANAMMKKSLDISVFETCPIVGAYYVCCVPHSVLVNDLLKHVGEHGFNDRVERTISHHIEPLREQARRLIREHRFVIEELMRYPGVMTANTDALETMEKRNGRTEMSGTGSAELAEWDAVVTRDRR